MYLECLDLRGIAIEDDVLVTLSKGIESNKGIQILIIRDCEIDDENLRQVVEHLESSNIYKLDLSKNELTPEVELVQTIGLMYLGADKISA